MDLHEFIRVYQKMSQKRKNSEVEDVVAIEVTQVPSLKVAMPSFDVAEKLKSPYLQLPLVIFLAHASLKLADLATSYWRTTKAKTMD